MKTPLVAIILIVVGILGLLLVYSQTGLHEKVADIHAAASGGYGGGSVVRGVDYGTMVVIIAIFAGVLLWSPIRNTFGKKK
ncbi:MAG: hypothetical protein Q8N09_02300 [Thermodesulfovibrionia bacterium]|nr:hypothetical protein [Thermodesulfovibrionia bacterium]